MESKEIIGAGSALQTLVHQFSDPLSFYRELVQNALDAGSRHVDVLMSYTPEGQTEIIVEDSGMGMTAEIIDSQLTCLFSSQKDDDLTLIGKFGIGFVSVFALNPELVTVETARDGEAWRIDFFQDGSFERRQLDELREGTKIRLLKTTTLEVFKDLKTRSKATLLYWCKHVNGEVSFCGEAIVSPFGIEVDCPLVWSEPDTEIQIGYASDFRSFMGFYNQGLTLLESSTEHTFKGLVVKINSKYLEHTLTRDQVVQDEHFAKLMTKVRELIESELPQRLFAELEARDNKRESLCEALSTHYGARPLRTIVSNQLIHARGEADGENWVAWPTKHPKGLICDGPSVEDLGEVSRCEAVFRLRLPPDKYTSPEEFVAKIGVTTVANRERYLVHQSVYVKDFDSRQDWTDFILTVPYSRSDLLDFLVDWKGEVPLVFKEIRLREPVKDKRDLSAIELNTLAFRTASNQRISSAEILRAHHSKSLYLAPRCTFLTEAALDAGKTVLLVEPNSAEHQFLGVLLKSTPLWLAQSYALPQVADEDIQSSLKQSLKSLVQSWNIDLRDVRLATSCCDQDWSALMVTEIGKLEVLKKANQVVGHSGKRILVLNAQHSAVQRLLGLAQTRVALAGFLLMKLFLVQGGVSDQMDSQLALRAWREMKS